MPLRIVNSRLLVVGCAFVVIGSLSFVIAWRSSGMDEGGSQANPHGMLVLRFPTMEIPAIVHSIHVRLVGEQNMRLEDSIVVRRISNGPTQIGFYPTTGRWSMFIRGRDAEGWTRFAGMEWISIEEEMRRVGTVRMNPFAAQSDRREVIIRWGEEPERWKMSLNNPVIAADLNGWDSDHYYIVNPAVIRQSSRYSMWYCSAYNLHVSGIDSMWIGYAFSEDGHHWEKKGPIRFQQAPPSWAGHLLQPGSVLVENDEYWLWFSGSTKALGRARSKDGLLWKIDPDPVLLTSEQQPALVGPCVVKSGGKFYMYYTVIHYGNDHLRYEIWMQISDDANTWNTPRRVLERRIGIAGEAYGVGWPFVMATSEGMHMFYSGVESNATGIFEAESRDGVMWTNRSPHPSLGPGDSDPWATEWQNSACGILEGENVKLWFTGFSQRERRWQIGCAERTLYPTRSSTPPVRK